jgi:dual specificity tyrosine-phosphorylation-regulated kinase 2/3/4
MSRCQKPLLNPAEIEVEGEIKVTLGDDIEYRYEILGFLGKGSFGEVFRAFDHQEKNEVAVKVVRSKEKYLEQARSEIEILKFIKEKSECKTQIVNFLRSFLFRNHLVLVFELLCENLYEFLRKNSFRGLKIQQIKKIACQVLKVLSFLEGVNLIHCDIKPENLLIQSSKSSSIKMIDFGSACFEERQVFTYIQSRFYRAPEIVFGMRYSSAIDIWSFGCLLVELYTGMPIFPAENEKELISCITEVLGEPSSSYLSKGTRSHIYFYADGHIKPFQNSRGRRRYPSYRSLKSILKSADEEFVSLVSSCLQWDPAHRISASSALKISWLCDTFKSPKVYGRYCKLSMEDIIKHTPHLHKLMTHKFKPSAIN